MNNVDTLLSQRIKIAADSGIHMLNQFEESFQCKRLLQQYGIPLQHTVLHQGAFRVKGHHFHSPMRYS